LLLCRLLPVVENISNKKMEENYLTEGPVSHELIFRLIEKMNGQINAGGHSMFLGQVRADEVNGRRVKAIEYSAYIELVTVEAEKIKKAVLSEFSDAVSIEIIHSTGIVNAGQISLLVVVSAGHRLHAMKACSKTVELIKENLPVWKKEIYDDDTHMWK
jgi:molybdopterin synthase catalytic subunit